MNLQQLISELQERNREALKQSGKSICSYSREDGNATMVVIPEDKGYEHLDQLTTDTAHAVALAIEEKIIKALLIAIDDAEKGDKEFGFQYFMNLAHMYGLVNSKKFMKEYNHLTTLEKALQDNETKHPPTNHTE